MGKIRKEGQSGAAANYVTRSQALRRLQLSIGDFRRLCILKGIHPREPKDRQLLKKRPGAVTPDQTFYHVKDIALLRHEPLLDRFRELRAFSKRVKKLVGKEEWARLKRLEAPTYTLDHLVRERYPTFLDALDDTDDALSMAALFAQLPQEVTANNGDHLKPLEKQRVDMARACFSLMRHWEAWVAKSGALRKAFISVKGIYYQAEVAGRPVTWLSPLDFAPSIPGDVDFRVMTTFLEFYQTLLKFVAFRLYAGVGWTFPFDASQYDAFQAGTERPVLLSELPEASSNSNNVDVAQQGLLRGTKVFLSREVPRRALAFLCQSMGCESIGWASLDENSPFADDDLGITHQIIDRPSLAVVVPGRTYVQPQWLFDSLNARRLLDPVEYKVGASLPPHRSPFVEDDGDELAADAAPEAQTEAEIEANEQKKLSLALLSKKKRRLYERIQHSRSRKTEQKRKLAEKKAALKAK